MKFVQSKQVGSAGEIYVKTTFEQAGIHCELIEGRNSYYDMACNFDGLIFYVEVKNDRKAHYTNNIALELYNTRSGQPSGLSITRADIWAHIVTNSIYLMGVPKMKKLLSQVKPAKIIEGGNNNSLIYLYDKSILHSFFLYNNKYELGRFLLCELK